MPTFIKTGYWEKIQKGYKGWLNLDDLIGSSIGTGSAGQLTYWNSPTSLSGGNLYYDSVNNRLTIGAGGFSGDFEINKQSAILQSYRNNNNGVNLTTGASVYQWDIIGQRNGAPSTLARMQVFYNGDGITRRGQLLLGVAETSGFGGASFLLSQTANNDKIVNLGMNVSSYLSNDTTITTTYAQHATVVVNGHTSLPIMSWDKQGIVQNIMFNNGNLALNSTTDAGYKLDVNGTARVQGLLSSYGADFFVAQSAGAGADYFHVDNDPNLSAGANNQIIALMRLRDRGGNGAFTGVNRVGIIMENSAGGQYPFQLFSESGNIRIGYSTVAASTSKLSIKGGSNDNTQLTINATAANDTATLRAYNSNQVIIGPGGTLNASAALQVESTTRGFLPPRVTTAEKNAIATPAAGLVVYDTTLNKLCVYTGAAWQTVSSA